MVKSIRYKSMNYTRKYLSITCLVLGLGLLLLPMTPQSTLQPALFNTARASTLPQSSESTQVYVLTFEGAVTPVLDQYIADGIETATTQNAEALILQLDTPGGSVDITKSINQKILGSSVPVVVYVAPAGAHAGSAGTFITLAGHAAAMAPGSSIGAASPVGGGGEDIGETMEAKVTNILTADIENLASRRGEEATEWAIAAVEEAAAATAQQALDLGVIDFIVPNLSTLLDELDGFEVTVQGATQTLNTKNAFITRVELNSIQRFLNYLANPSIAALLLTLGSAGLLAEVWNPGTWIPGTIGLICLLLGLYALGQLDANYAGLGLIILAIILFISEAFTPTFGLLTLAGAVSFVLGGVLLFDAPGVQVPWGVLIVLSISLAAFSFFAGGMALRAQNRPVTTGSEGLIGQVARVKSPFGMGERGSVFVSGEWWNAQLENSEANMTQDTQSTYVHLVGVGADEEVEVVDRKGYTLIVRKLGAAA